MKMFVTKMTLIGILATGSTFAATFDIPNIECRKGTNLEGWPTVMVSAPEVSYEAEVAYSTTTDQDLNLSKCIGHIKGWRIETDDGLFSTEHVFIFHTNDGSGALGRAINWIPFVGRGPELKYAVRKTAQKLFTAATDVRFYTKR